MKSILLILVLFSTHSALAQTLTMRSGEESMLGSLRIVCQGPSEQKIPACQIIGSGDYGDYKYAYRIQIGNDIVFGTNSIDLARNHIGIL
jgi:hypothetical protein